MRFDVISLFSEMVRDAAHVGVTGRACERGIVELVTWNPRDFTTDVHRTVDDQPYGGGPGMVMKVEPLRDAIVAAKQADSRPAAVVFLSPQGRQLNQEVVCEFSRRQRLILLCGRYEGIDQRLIDSMIDEQWSIGDYVLSGGELPALVLIDSVTRLLPDVLGHVDSAMQDSFMNGLLDHPHYTRPARVDNLEVPEVLQSGHHQHIQQWRMKQALGATWKMRPDLLQNYSLNAEQLQLLEEFKNEQHGK
ncbi:MAG: tRNA (guanosine(37)-N1)-methyltransferase TrmD [Methylococcales bacterium]